MQRSAVGWSFSGKLDGEFAEARGTDWQRVADSSVVIADRVSWASGALVFHASLMISLNLNHAHGRLHFRSCRIFNLVSGRRPLGRSILSCGPLLNALGRLLLTLDPPSVPSSTRARNYLPGNHEDQLIVTGDRARRGP